MRRGGFVVDRFWWRHLRFLWCVVFFLGLHVSLAAQGTDGKVVLGRVLAVGQGSPIVGAVVEAGGRKAITDRQGNFILLLSLGTVRGELKVSYVGFKVRSVPFDLSVDQKLVVSLEEDATDLGSVNISTGYESRPRERLTGSFELVDNKKLNALFGPNILNRLEGTAAGVSFDRDGQRPGLTVRGLSSINASKSPLIVLDNFPYAGDINNINPNDIENITVLKDAAASSIWGARAGNGVIVITSKKGRRGQPLSVSLNSNVSFTQQPDIYKSRDFIASADYIDLESFLFGKGFYQSTLDNTFNYPVVSPVVELLAKRGVVDGAGKAEIDRQIAALKNNDVRRDIDRYLYKTGFAKQYALNINGGAERMLYYYSAGYDRGENYLGVKNDRFSLRAQNSFELTGKLSLSTGLVFTVGSSASGRPDYTAIRPGVSQALYPYARLADDAGNPLAIPKTYRESYVATAGGGKLLDWRYYPLEDYRYVENGQKTLDLVANVNLEHKVFSWLKAGLRYQFERQNLDGENLYGEGSFFTRDLINQFTQINSATGAVKYIVPRGGILDLNRSVLNAHNFRTQLNVDRSWGDHSVTALMGMEAGRNSVEGASYRSYGYNDDLGVVTGLIDPVNRYPLFYGGMGTVANANTFNGTDNRSLSYFANAAYSFKGRYSLSGSVRKDQSNLFGVRTNQRGRPFWSAGAAWEVSKEDFFHSELLPYLKLRMTYGSSGNLDNSMSALTVMSYSSTPNSQTGFTQALINKFANPELRWEKTQMANIGIDFALRGDRISGSFEYYEKRGSDLLGDALVDPTAGLKVATIRKNVASMKGRGAELTVRTVNTKGAVRWMSSLLFSYNLNRVKDYYLSSYQGSVYINQGNLVTPVSGYPVYSIFSYRWAGLDPVTGDPQGYLGGAVSKDYAAITGTGTQVADLVYNGPSTPVYSGAFGNTVVYGDFEFSVNLIYKLGYYFRKNSVDYSSLFSAGVQHSDYADRWQVPGDELRTQVPSLIYPASAGRDALYAGSEALVRKGDHVRLQYVSLSYALQREHFKRLPFKELKLSLNVSNLGVLWSANKDGIDPDYPYALTPPGTFIFGLRATF